jgi:hypothetical protein
MYKFVLDEKTFGALLPLADLVDRMRLGRVVTWRFRDIKLMGYGHPFGMTPEDFETASRTSPLGIEVSNDEFQRFLKSDFQVIDGLIEAWSGEIPATRLVSIDCEDAAQWEVTTELTELARQFETTGLKRRI